MAKGAEMSAKDIAALFRSAVEAEDEALLSDRSTFADQDFFTQLGWFTDQIEARLSLKKNTPSPDVLALIAALGGAIGKRKPKDCVDEAYETWNAADMRIREETLCSRDEIEDNLSQVGVDFRLGAWTKKNDGSDRINLEFVPFMRLCIPDHTEDELKTLYRDYIEETHPGEKKLNREGIQSRLREKTGSRFLPEALNAEGRQIVGWWMKHESFDPLSFPNGSLGQLTQIALGMMPEK